MTSTYGERLYASLYSQSFQNANPRGWSLSPAAVTEALDVLAAKARDYAAKPSRETMIEQFRLAFPGEQGNWLPGRGAEQEYATWLYDVAWDIATAPEQADDEPADVQTSGLLPYPDAPDSFTAFHPSMLTRLREWADNGVDDVGDGVDLMANYLRERGAWMTDSCATTAEAKDFLGNVMRYKTALLAASEPEAPTSDDLPRRFTIVRDSASPNVRIAAPVGTLVELVADEWRGDNGIVPFRVVGTDGQPIPAEGALGCWWIGMDSLEEKPWREPQIGEFYTVVGNNPVGSGYSHGDTVGILSDREDVYGTPTWRVQRAGDRSWMSLYRQHLSMEPVEPVQTSGQTVGEVIDAQVQPLQDEITSLKAQLEQAEQNYANAQARHQGDMDTISRHFWENAHRRGWCSEAEDVIDEINSETHLDLERDRNVYRPKSPFYLDLDVRFTALDDHGLEWVLNVTLEVEVMGVDRDDAIKSITDDIIIANAKSAYPNLPDDLRVDEWDTA